MLSGVAIPGGIAVSYLYVSARATMNQPPITTQATTDAVARHILDGASISPPLGCWPLPRSANSAAHGERPDGRGRPTGELLASLLAEAWVALAIW
jgi:hypothetical protein